MNLSETTSHRSIRSLKPFSKASKAVVFSGCCQSASFPVAQGERNHTVSLDTQVHLLLGGMRDGVTAELDVGAVGHQHDGSARERRGDLNSLLHNRKPQCIPQRMPLVIELERSSGLGGSGQLSSKPVSQKDGQAGSGDTHNYHAGILHLQNILLLRLGLGLLVLRRSVDHRLVVVLGVDGFRHYAGSEGLWDEVGQSRVVEGLQLRLNV
jgi:hypothetical protein